MKADTKDPKLEFSISKKIKVLKLSVPRAAFRNVKNSEGSYAGGSCVFLLKGYDVVMKISSDSLTEFQTSSEAAIKTRSWEADIESSGVLWGRADKESAVPQESIRKLKLMLSSPASNFLTFCDKLFREGCACCCVWDNTFWSSYKSVWAARWKKVTSLTVNILFVERCRTLCSTT